MTLVLNLIYFVILIVIAFWLLYKEDAGIMSVPFDVQHRKMRCSGLEMLLVFIFATGLMGLMPVLALHLAVIEIVCVLAIRRAPYNVIYSWPMKIFTLFIVWCVIGVFYSTSISFGFRMILKYIYPLIIALFATAVVRDKEVFLKACQWGRWIALLSFVVVYLPMRGFIFQGVFWEKASLATNYTVWMVFSLALAYAGVEWKKNVVWTVFFILPCILWVFRTNIFGTAIALSAFYFIRYRLKAAPIILGLACLAVGAIFYIPSVKKKMYFRPDEVTVTDFLTGNVREDNINTSGRKIVWEDVENYFYEGHEIVGSGTGRVQTYFYTEALGWRRGGQLHNDLLLMKCDNGLVGLTLFLLTYVAILFHCVYIYYKSEIRSVRICTLVAGASLMGIFVTTYSDNTVSYSLATLSYPWAIYGMALGLSCKEKENRYVL